MLRLAAPRPLVVLVCRRCLSAAAAATAPSRSRSPASVPTPLLTPAASRTLRLGWQPRRGFLRLPDGLRAWFTEGPEAATPAAEAAAMAAPPLPPPPLDDAAAGVTSFFVQDAPSALQEFLEGGGAAAADQLLASAAEPAFASLGLGTGFWPSSMQLKLLETLHVSLDAPWWLCAVLMGIGVRLVLLLPNMQLQRMMRADLPKLRNIMDVTERIKFAVRSGNMPESIRLQQLVLEQFPELTTPEGSRRFMRRNVVTVLGNFLAMSLVQVASIRAIYKATSLPVDSFQQGGILWVTDLTCIDPYFVMPAAITGLLMLNVRYYFKNVTAANNQVLLIKPLAYSLLPTFVFTCLLNFPGANLFYFLATGCTAQLLNRANNTEAGKAFWKARIGLPRIEEVPRPPSPQASGAVDRIRNQILPAMNDRDYQATRLPDRPTDGQIPKTYRVRRVKA